MTKPNDKNDDHYKALGFESAFDGTATGIQWSELVEGLKTNVLRQNLRVRKFVMGEYDTKSAGDRDLASKRSYNPKHTAYISLCAYHCST